MSVILITGARAPIALDLARSFTAAGHEVHLADSIRPWAARLSKDLGGRLHRFAPPRFAFPQFARDLAELVARLDPTLIVPTSEEVFYVAEAAARYGFANRLFAPPPAVLKRLHSKVEFAVLARQAGVAAPETARASSRAELEGWRGRASSLVFKPEFSRFGTHVRIRPDARAFDRIDPSPASPWTVQDFVAGEEVCIWSAAIAGELVAFAAYRPLWRVGRSASFYFETDADPALFETARKIVRTVGASGQFSFDVIRRPDGIIAPIECNPRGISGVHLFDAAPRLAQALLGETGLQKPMAAARHLGLAMWMLGAPSALLTGRIGAFGRDLTRSRDALAGAGIGTLLDAGRFAAIGMSRGRSAAGQSTDDIEWNGEPIP